MGGIFTMGVLITLLILAFIAWATFTQIMARQQRSVSCSYGACYCPQNRLQVFWYVVDRSAR